MSAAASVTLSRHCANLADPHVERTKLPSSLNIVVIAPYSMVPAVGTISRCLGKPTKTGLRYRMASTPLTPSLLRSARCRVTRLSFLDTGGQWHVRPPSTSL